MSSHNEQVQPAAFDVARPADESPQKPAPAQKSWVLPALVALAVVAALVIFWLPRQIGPSSVDTSTAGESAVEAPVTSAPALKKQVEEASPWSDAQLAKLRKAAQDELVQLLEIQELLEQTAVNLWASEDFEQAKALAAEGDRLYRERNFVEAQTGYQQGRLAMQAILERTDDILDRQLEQGRQAIEAGDSAVAKQALSVAEAIEPGSSELAVLNGRLATLEPLLALLSGAEEAEESGDLAGAETLLKEATSLDPAHQRAAAELARVAEAHIAMRFNDAMSDGYLALDERSYSTARAAFKKAASLVPGSSEAASALEEVQVAETADRLGALQVRGRKAEDNEQWQAAVEAYQQALKMDANILFAQEGLQRSAGRSELDEYFSRAIGDPGRLSDIAIAEAVQTRLDRAMAINPRGPLLTQQINKLQTTLKLAGTPLAITLLSDGETEVIVYKVARLGQFQQRQLTLRPGKYTAVGTRNGFRDVRVTFDLSHNGSPPSVLISCTEQI